MIAEIIIFLGIIYTIQICTVFGLLIFGNYDDKKTFFIALIPFSFFYFLLLEIVDRIGELD
ncbi:unnamed protein product [marine sediment metagenome]|uniref:Uncharacterized protein n=1 Tax=marine sediment metagenome TaxID=412755 RepID=X0UQU8_9ZZZZ